MHFSTVISALAIGAEFAAAAQHSHRSLQHVGKQDFPNKPKRQERHPRGAAAAAPSASKYLNNATSRRSSETLNLKSG